MNDDDNDGQMIFGDLKLPDICLAGEDKPHPGNLSRPGIELGRACYRLFHSGEQLFRGLFDDLPFRNET